jgi:hypothetical protein
MTEVRGQKSEVRSKRTREEDRIQKAEVRRPRSGDSMLLVIGYWFERILKESLWLSALVAATIN